MVIFHFISFHSALSFISDDLPLGVLIERMLQVVVGAGAAAIDGNSNTLRSRPPAESEGKKKPECYLPNREDTRV